MALTNQESEMLHNEARDLYDQYGRLKAEVRDDRSNDSLQEKLSDVQTRYETIVTKLKKNGVATSEEDAHVANFDVGHYRAHKPIVSDPEDGDGIANLLFGVLKPRTVIVSLVIVFLGITFGLMSNRNIGFFVVPSSSMEPTLIPDDKLVTFRKTKYRRGDIIVLIDPAEKGAFLVKRLVAFEDDDIFIYDGIIKVNSKEIDEPYINEDIDYQFGPYHVGKGQVFVLGDNRNYSDDSHKWGKGVPEDSIVGKVLYIYSPRGRTGPIKSGSEQFSSAGL